MAFFFNQMFIFIETPGYCVMMSCTSPEIIILGCSSKTMYGNGEETMVTENTVQ